MSEGAQNIGDEPPVVGEPASQPHQAAVVGEPPEEMVPVLGEPVPLANGLQQDQERVSSPSTDESAINGIHKETSPADEPPAMAHAADEHTTTEEVSAEEGIHRSTTENPIQPESISGTSDARAQEVPNRDADTPEDVEVTHIVDAPSEPPLPESEISTENPFSILDEGSAETDLKVSDEGEEPVVTDVPDEAHEEAASPAQDEEFTNSSGPTVDSQEGDAVSPVAHEETTRGLSASTHDSRKEASEERTTDAEDKNVSDGVSEESKLSETPESKEVNVAEPQPIAVAHKEESNVGISSPQEIDMGTRNSTNEAMNEEDEKTEEKPADLGSSVNKEELVNKREAELPEGKSHEKISKEGEDVDASVEASPDEAEQVENREAVLPEVVSSDKIFCKEGEKQAAPDSSLVQIDKNVTADAFPMESSGLRDIAAEADNVDQPPSDEGSLEENGFQHGQDGIPLEKEQGSSKDEKPNSRFKLPMVFTTLAIAVVGVAVASFGRSRQ